MSTEPNAGGAVQFHAHQEVGYIHPEINLRIHLRYAAPDGTMPEEVLVEAERVSPEAAMEIIAAVVPMLTVAGSARHSAGAETAIGSLMPAGGER